MHTHQPISDTQVAELLEHSTWVRRLAGSLVRDDALADELTQEAWLAALAHPPTQGLPVRPWLGQVLRNLVRMRFRGEQRRHTREAKTQETEAQQDAGRHSPEQLLARLQTQRELSSLVVELDEPFRSTVLLRYYEGLSAAEIAARQDVPAGTVRWRLKSAIDKLRAELDRTHGGDRQAWLPAVAPLALELPNPSAQAASLGVNVQSALGLKAWLPMVLLISVGATGLWVAQHRAARPSRPAESPQLAAPAPAPALERDSSAAQRLNKDQRTQLLERIGHAHQSASISGEGAPALDKDYIREQMQSLIPLVKECYENTLLKLPQLEGQLTVSFTIVAEPELGGLVAESTIVSDGSTINDEAMRECVQETMYGAKFPAPKGGGELHVTYPFIFHVAP